MGEAPIQPELPPTLTVSIPCFSCAYDLRGLSLESVCPECGLSIRESMRISALRYPLPLPAWLCIARSAYLAAAVTLISAPWMLPQIARYFGLPVVRGWSGTFGVTHFLCALSTAGFGVALAALLSGYGNRWNIPVGIIAFLLIVVGLMGLGN